MHIATFMLSLLLLVLSVTVAHAQITMQDAQKRRSNGEDIVRRSRALDQLENSAENARQRELSQRDLELRARQVKIANDIRELNETTDSLVQLLARETTDDKGADKFAGKIAKISKRLRQELNGGKSTPKAEPFALSTNDRLWQLQQLALLMDKGAEELGEEQNDLIYTVDLTRTEGAIKKLTLIESQALGIKELARRKK